ncbi:MAG: hypothetical protein PHU53_07270 [Thermoplasmata archaeon]|nr:hypothetical protein [Thermoplasmata archaeon]
MDNSKIRLVATEYDKPRPSRIDGLEVYKSLRNDFKNEDKDVIIERLMGEIAMLSHFIAKSHPEYIKFVGDVRSRVVSNDDLLSLDLEEPDMNNAIEMKDKGEIGGVKDEW